MKLQVFLSFVISAVSQRPQRGPIVRLESNVAQTILTVSENWITESSHSNFRSRLDSHESTHTINNKCLLICVF